MAFDDFRSGAAFQSQEGDYAIIRLQAIRIVDIEVSWINHAALQQAIQVSLGFASSLQITQDFLNFAELIAGLPLVIPKDSSLPLANFMEAEIILNPQYHTFEADYYLSSIKQRPRIHVNTGLSFPFSLWAQLVVDCQIVYRKESPMKEHPAVPFDHTRHIIDRWAVDFPDQDTYGSGAIQAFQDSFPYSGYWHRFVYIDCLWIYDGGTNQFAAVSGVKIDPDGRPFYWGTEEDLEHYPLNFSVWGWTAPPRKLHVDSAFQSISGEIRGYTSPELLICSPPLCPTVFTGGIAPILAGLFGGGIIDSLIHIGSTPGVVFSGVLDGLWRVGYGGCKIL
ncbi:MAG: hypothetical protein MUP17_12765 [candidate division Zixibacteria bacterium]|nr:hypothetical protein [candidate division Zixibacteria bacterium]